MLIALLVAMLAVATAGRVGAEEPLTVAQWFPAEVTQVHSGASMIREIHRGDLRLVVRVAARVAPVKYRGHIVKFRSFRSAIRVYRRHTLIGSLSTDGGAAYRLAILAMPNSRQSLVVVDEWSGGNNCCVSSFIGFSGASRVNWIRKDFGNTWESFGRGAHHQALLVVGNDTFAYTLGAQCCAFLPVEVFEPRNGRIENVTHYYPLLVAHDADAALAQYAANESKSLDLSALAGYLYDEARIGKARSAITVVKERLASTKRRFPDSTDYIGGPGNYLQRILAALPAPIRKTFAAVLAGRRQ